MEIIFAFIPSPCIALDTDRFLYFITSTVPVFRRVNECLSSDRASNLRGKLLM